MNAQDHGLCYFKKEMLGIVSMAKHINYSQ